MRLCGCLGRLAGCCYVVVWCVVISGLLMLCCYCGLVVCGFCGGLWCCLVWWCLLCYLVCGRLVDFCCV